jgi:hypothetical protein
MHAAAAPPMAVTHLTDRQLNLDISDCRRDVALGGGQRVLCDPGSTWFSP